MRIKEVCETLNFSDLSEEQKNILLELRDHINKEQLYAASAAELRKPINWNDD